MLPPVLITAPSELPVTLAEAKANSRIDADDEDAFIQSLIQATVSHLDGYTGILGRCIVNQDWRQDFKDWDWRFRLPFPNVSTATITYRDGSDVEQTVSSDDYEIIEDTRSSLIVFKDAFQEPAVYDDRFTPISVTFTAGYGGASDVPDGIRHAILLLVGHHIETRTAVSERTMREVPLAFSSLIAPYRRRVAG